MLAERSFGVVVRSVFQARHYRALFNSFRTYHQPVSVLARYLFGVGTYPAEVELKTPLGPTSATLYSRHDVLTVNEVFCRHDYRFGSTPEVCVDFGSNIGLSALYFLTRSATSRCYLFEPLPVNCDRLRANLADLDERYDLAEVAISDRDSIVDFGVEASGRYGGIGLHLEETMQVPAVSANDALRRVIERDGHVDLLKIDIESQEQQVVDSLAAEVLERIRYVAVEFEFEENPFGDRFTMRQYGPIAQFENLSWPPTGHSTT